MSNFFDFQSCKARFDSALLRFLTVFMLLRENLALKDIEFTRMAVSSGWQGSKSIMIGMGFALGHRRYWAIGVRMDLTRAPKS